MSHCYFKQNIRQQFLSYDKTSCLNKDQTITVKDMNAAIDDYAKDRRSGAV